MGCSLPEASHAMRLTQRFEVENTTEKGETLRKVKPATVRGGDHFARRYQVCAGDTLTLRSYRVYCEHVMRGALLEEREVICAASMGATSCL